jgi:hypothetical protein
MSTDSSQTKTCKVCCMEIPEAAKKCPYCHSWLIKFAISMADPRFGAIVFAMILVMFLSVYSFISSSLFPRGEKYSLYADQISILDSQMEFGQDDKGPTVAVLGHIKNDSDVDWKDVCFVVEFHDAQGKLIDADQKFEFFHSFIPAHDTTAFKLSFLREFPEDKYAAHVARILGAKDNKAKF